MEVTVAKKELLRLVTRMQGVAERKSTMPALSSVLINADGGTLRLSATDLYLAISGQVAADVKTAGSFALPAKDLFERVKMMPDGPIHIATHENATATLKAAGSARRYTLRGMPGEEFPQLPQPAEGAAMLALEASVLLELIAKTSFSVATDETRAHLNSALFEWDGDIVRMVSTDGHRLSKIEVKVAGRQATATMLIPLKAVHELRRYCEDIVSACGTAQLQITQNASSAFFTYGDSMFSTKLVTAQFPPYEQVIPKAQTKTIRAPRLMLADAIRAVSIAANEKSGMVKLELATGVIKISGESANSGDGSDEVSVEYTGETMAIGFNAKYLLDVLGALEEETVILGMKEDLDPVTVRPEGERAYTAVVMPARA